MLYSFTQSNEPGAQYCRASKVVLNNPKDGQRSSTYQIEQITVAANDCYVSNDVANIVINSPSTAAERSVMVDLVDLQGRVVGQMKQGDMIDRVLLFLNSQMVHYAKQQAQAEIEKGDSNESL